MSLKNHSYDLSDFVGLAVFPLSLFVTYFMLNFTPCLVDECTYENDQVESMQIALGVYHGWLWITGGALYLAKTRPGVKKVLIRQVYHEVSLAQVLLGVWLTALLIFNTTFWHDRFQDEWANGDDFADIKNITAYRTPYEVTQQSGRFLEILLGLALIPVARHSVLDRVFDLSFVNAIAFHRAIGWWFVLVASLHAASFTYAATQNPGQSWQSLVFNMYDARKADEMAENNMSYLDWGNGMYMNEMGVIAYIFMLPAAALSVAYIRRNFYNVFYAFHLLLHVMVVFAWLHASTNFYYTLPGIGLYTIDICMRLFLRFDKLSYVNVVSTKQEVGGKVRVYLATKNRMDLQNAKPEAFIRVCIPKVTGLEWHPYTLVSSPSDVAVTSILMSTRQTAPNTMNWTRKATQHLLNTSSGEVDLALEGPFGGSTLDMATLGDRPILFLTAGSGITPAIGIACANTCRHIMVWSVRLLEEEKAGASSSFSLFGELPSYIEVVVHETRDPSGNANMVKVANEETVVDQGTAEAAVMDAALQENHKQVKVESGRVNFGETLNRYLENPDHPISTVFVSGPPAFKKDAIKAIREFEKLSSRKLTVVIGSFEL